MASIFNKQPLFSDLPDQEGAEGRPSANPILCLLNIPQCWPALTQGILAWQSLDLLPQWILCSFQISCSNLILLSTHQRNSTACDAQKDLKKKKSHKLGGFQETALIDTPLPSYAEFWGLFLFAVAASEKCL